MSRQRIWDDVRELLGPSVLKCRPNSVQTQRELEKPLERYLQSFDDCCEDSQVQPELCTKLCRLALPPGAQGAPVPPLHQHKAVSSDAIVQQFGRAALIQHLQNAHLIVHIVLHIELHSQAKLQAGTIAGYIVHG